MGQRLKNKNCSKWKLWENFVVISGGFLAQMDQEERGEFSRGVSAAAPSCPTSGGSAPCVGMLQSTGHKEIWDDTGDS